MRFLMLGIRRRSYSDKHQQRPARIDSPSLNMWGFGSPSAPCAPNPSPDFVTTSAADDDAEIEALLRELGEEPFDVWARLCAPAPTPEREPSMRVRRASKPRMGIRRRGRGAMNRVPT